MARFILPAWVKEHNLNYEDAEHAPREVIARIRRDLEKFNIENPLVSIVIPAYNEEKNILRTLSSLSRLKTQYPTEIIVANNNSTDKTQMLLDMCGVKSAFAENKGISYARQAGLDMAKGKYIVNADSDTIYPQGWIDALIEPLKNSDVSCTYGCYSFIPSSRSGRIGLGFYEIVAEALFSLKRKNRECVNVMGFNFAFRKEDAVKIGGFEHCLQRQITGRSEDGWMALCLMKVGKIQMVKNPKARVWTSDRRLMDDGSLGKAFLNRVKREMGRMWMYVSPKGAVKVGNN